MSDNTSPGNRNGNNPLHEDTSYGVKVWFEDGHTEVSWWYGQPHGFWSWYDKITETYHPHITAKAPVVKNIQMMIGEKVLIDGR